MHPLPEMLVHQKRTKEGPFGVFGQMRQMVELGESSFLINFLFI